MTCPFYEVRVREVRSQEIGSSFAEKVWTPWCSHPHSSVPERAARSLGGGCQLQCEGDLASCQVPEDLRMDLKPRTRP
jgi:hypothetical protein